MSQQSHFSLDSWEWKQSSRKPLFGNSEGVFTPRQPERDQTLALPGIDAKDAAAWLKDNERRLQLAADSLAENDELLGLLAENLRRGGRNRYNLEVYLAIARLYRQNVRMLLDYPDVSAPSWSAPTVRRLNNWTRLWLWGSRSAGNGTLHIATRSRLTRRAGFPGLWRQTAGAFCTTSTT